MQHSIERYVAGGSSHADHRGQCQSSRDTPRGCALARLLRARLRLRRDATHTINGEDHRLSRGSVFLLTPADFHGMRADSEEPLSGYNVVIDSWLWETRLASFFLSGPENMPWVMLGAAKK